MAQLEGDDGWVALGGVGQRLAVLSSDFDPRTYGYGKLGDLVEKTGSFEIDRSRGQSVTSAWRQPSASQRADRTAIAKDAKIAATRDIIQAATKSCKTLDRRGHRKAPRQLPQLALAERVLRSLRQLFT